MVTGQEVAVAVAVAVAVFIYFMRINH